MSQLIDAAAPRVSENNCRNREVSPRCVRERIARRALISRLAQLQHGQIRLVEGNSEQSFGQLTPQCPLAVTLTVHRSRFFPRATFGGDIGAAESFMDGEWSCDNLTDLVRILIVNSQSPVAQPSWLSRLVEPIYRVAHWFNRNTKRGSRRNIAAHYDLGNDFFELILDETRMYSCGLFADSDSTMFDASTAKNELICRKLKLTPQDHLLEIGTGWGGFALHAARNHGCRVTTTTICANNSNMRRNEFKKQGW